MITSILFYGYSVVKAQVPPQHAQASAHDQQLTGVAVIAEVALFSKKTFYSSYFYISSII